MKGNFTVTSRLGSDAELRYVKDGSAVSNFSLPVTSGYGDNKVTTWVRFVLWGKRAESLNQYLTKGALVSVVGELDKVETFTRKDGTTGANLVVKVTDIELLGGGTPNGNGGASSPVEEDDVPF